jgi:starch synthase
MTALTPLYIKKHYKGDPCFKNSKVIYSVYNDEFKQPFGANFANKAKVDGISKDDLKTVEEKADFEALSKLAVDFSDGIIQGSASIHPEVKKYAQEVKKVPFLEYHPEETYIEAINNFYDQILSK